MAFLDILEAAGDIPEALYIKFLHKYKLREKSLHCFFEGLDDQSFYANFIETIFSNNCTFHYYVCNGKSNVYQNYNDINWSFYNKNRVLFFTDKDVDDLIGKSYTIDNNIFETKYYSIENYLVDVNVYSRFLREICYITDNEALVFLQNKFAEELDKFHDLMMMISAWVIYCRRNDLHVNLNEVEISKIFIIDNELKIRKITPNGYKTAFEYICAATKTSHYNFAYIKDIAENIIKIENPKVYIRGKYELWFLYAFCEKTISEIIPKLNNKIKKYNEKNKNKLTKCKVTISVKPENILQIVAPRTRIPNELSNFLIRNFKDVNMDI